MTYLGFREWFMSERRKRAEEGKPRAKSVELTFDAKRAIMEATADELGDEVVGKVAMLGVEDVFKTYLGVPVSKWDADEMKFVY